MVNQIKFINTLPHSKESIQVGWLIYDILTVKLSSNKDGSQPIRKNSILDSEMKPLTSKDDATISMLEFQRYIIQLHHN